MPKREMDGIGGNWRELEGIGGNWRELEGFGVNRSSRVLTNLMLLRAGYSYASYASLESVIEHNSRAERDSLPEAARRVGAGAHSNEVYYLALRRTQTSFGSEQADWEPWLLFFLRSLKSQTARLRERLETVEAPSSEQRIPEDLSPLAGRLLELLEARGNLSVGEASEALGANRHTLKDKFGELVAKGHAELHGKGRGAHYRPVRK